MKKILIITILTGTFSACTIGMPKITDNALSLKVSDANQYAGTIYLRGQKYYNDFKTPGHSITVFHPALSNAKNNEVKINIDVKYEEKKNKPIPSERPNILKKFNSKYIGDCNPKERCKLTQENLTIVLPTAISLKIDEKKASYMQKIQQDKKELAKAENTSCGIDTACETDKQNLISSKKASISQAESSIAALDKEEQKKFDFKIVYEYAGFNKMNTGINIDSYEALPDSISAYCDRKQCMITDNKGNPVNSITIKRKMTVNSKRIAQLIALDKKKAEAAAAAERERRRKAKEAAEKRRKEEEAAIERDRESVCKDWLGSYINVGAEFEMVKQKCQQWDQTACQVVSYCDGSALKYLYATKPKLAATARKYSCPSYLQLKGFNIY